MAMRAWTTPSLALLSEGRIAAQQTQSGKVTPARRLLAEALRYDEAAQGPPPAAAESVAMTRARAAPASGDKTRSLEQKIVVRAETLADGRLRDEIARMWSALRAIAIVAVVIAAIVGAATARTVMAGAATGSVDGTTVNFYWALASLLGLHVLAFLVWLGLIIAMPGSTQGGLLGALIFWLWRQFAGHIATGRERAAAAAAMVTVWGQGRPGRWLISMLSHGIWTGYLVGALLMTFALLSAQRFNFVWETTILDAGAYVALTAALAALPALLGLAMPNRAAVLAAEWPGPVAAGNEGLWSTLLIAAILLYGVLPRLLAVVTCFVLARRAASATPLDLSRPGFARLVPLLSPTVTVTKIVDPAASAPVPPAAAPNLHQPPSPPTAGPVYVLGWEIDAPESGWPPGTGAEHLHDLGLVDGRDDLARAIAALRQAAPTPARVVVVVALPQTPDHGTTKTLQELREASNDRLFILFSGEATLRRRIGASDAEIRIADWVSAAARAGILPAQMVAIDLDTPDAAAAARLARLVGRSP